MKRLSTLVLISFVLALGCGRKENPLATDGATAEDFAKYEAELAAVSGGDSYEDAEGGDDEVE